MSKQDIEETYSRKLVEIKEMITAKTLLLGLIGYPVSHSLSPVMHNAAFKKLGLDYIYLVFPVKSNKDLKRAIEGLRAINFKGANVTIPYKEEVIKYLDEISKEAKLIGAVNTIENIEGKLYGYNTDSFGFIKSLKEEINTSLKDKKVFILGAGGAAKAVAFSLVFEGVSEVIFADKFKEKAVSLSKYMKKKTNGKYLAINLEDVKLGKKINLADLIINATSVGMKEEDPLPLEVKYLRKDQIIYDLVYNPSQTLLLKEGEKLNLKVISGLGMLLYQGAKSFEIWTKVKAPIEVMKRSLIENLD
ncbi:MAG: shikimate dehydrogenase [bacterium]